MTDKRYIQPSTNACFAIKKAILKRKIQQIKEQENMKVVNLTMEQVKIKEKLEEQIRENNFLKTRMNLTEQTQRNQIDILEKDIRKLHIENKNTNTLIKKLQDNKSIETIEIPEIDKYKCILCFDKDRIITLLPCKHFVLCENCSEPLEKCPVCRWQIREKILNLT